MKNIYKLQTNQRHRHTNNTEDKTLNNIKIDLKCIKWQSVDWIYLAQGRDKSRGVINVVMDIHSS
jgi:hypothetical protein